MAFVENKYEDSCSIADIDGNITEIYILSIGKWKDINLYSKYRL